MTRGNPVIVRAVELWLCCQYSCFVNVFIRGRWVWSNIFSLSERSSNSRLATCRWRRRSRWYSFRACIPLHCVSNKIPCFSWLCWCWNGHHWCWYWWAGISLPFSVHDHFLNRPAICFLPSKEEVICGGYMVNLAAVQAWSGVITAET